MKKQIFLLLAVTLSLAACSSSQYDSKEVRARKLANDAIWRTRQPVEYAGNVYEVAVSREKAVAYIAPKGGDFRYGPDDLEAVVASVTGCKATYASGILSSVGGYSGKADLRFIQSKISSFERWAVDIAC